MNTAGNQKVAEPKPRKNKGKEQAKEKEKELPQLVKTEDKVRYRVRKGDYLGKIAEKYGVGVSSIRRWNNMRSNNLRI